jgi:DNA mismatch repair ATPase MutS
VKVRLMHRERDLDLEAPLPSNEEALTQDLGLDTIFDVMGAGDEFVREVARRALLTSLDEPDAIVYRQDVLRDCLAQRVVVEQIYALAIEALGGEKTVGWFWISDSPDRILYRSVHVLRLYVDVLGRLRRLGEEHAGAFTSEGFSRFFAMLAEELDDDYLAAVCHHLRELEFRRGLVASAELGPGNKGRHYVVRRPRRQSWAERLSLAGRSDSHSFTIPDRDEGGFRALGELRDRAVNPVANALARSADHVKGFFTLLRAELAFCLAAANLRDRLDEKSVPACFPDPVHPDALAFAGRGLYDVALALHLDRSAVGNDVDADGRSLVVITGANQGGKSTFLRSVGLAQLMMQSGLFVGACSLRASVCRGVFTHFKREEDASMESGKLDEELARMSEIADAVSPGSLLLSNESFASTNEREGSAIARQVVRALVDSGVRVLFVTHLYDLAHGFYREGGGTTLFLLAGREADGRRTYELIEGEPLSTSFGADTYERIFGPFAGPEVAAVADRRA